METIVSLVATGVGKLIELIPVWVAASAEKKAEIEAKTRSLVAGLDALFSAADAKDDAATQAARDAIAGK